MNSFHLQELINISMIFIFGIILLSVFLGLSKLISPSAPSRVKGSSYECGEEIYGEISIPFHVHYYIFALLFLIFDVEIVFLVPWAIIFQELGTAGLVSMLIFLSLIMLGVIYPWRKGLLKWF